MIKANDIHRSAIVVDMHCDTAQRLVDENLNIHDEVASGHVDWVRLRRGGVTAQFFAIWVDPYYFGAGGANAVKRALAQIEAVRNLSRERPCLWKFATCADDIETAKRENKVATLLGLEGGYAIDEQLENVKRFYDLGVRYMSLTWNDSVSWAGSSGDDTGQTRGLNELGRNIVREMNRCGMMVDVSHVSDKTFRDVIDTSSKPVIASHSNARGLTDVRRNLDDAMIKAVARTNGCVCVVFYPAFLDDDWEQSKQALQRDTEFIETLKQTRERVGRQPNASRMDERIALEGVHEKFYRERLPMVSIEKLLDHIDYIVNLVGINHVGLGSDFDGIQAAPRDLEDCAQYPNITHALVKRGYTDADIQKILGGNILRVMRETNC